MPSFVSCALLWREVSIRLDDADELLQTDYSSTLFEKSIGFDSHMSSLMAGFLQTWFFVASFIPWLLIDRVGRRPLVCPPFAPGSSSNETFCWN